LQHPVAKFFWGKLIKFGQIWLDYGRNLGKIKILLPKNIRSPTAMHQCNGRMLQIASLYNVSDMFTTSG